MLSYFFTSISAVQFQLPKAYFATPLSVGVELIKNLNATNSYYEKLNMKHSYYLYMEFLQV
ncbi:hypothetical protein KSP39_PZI012539 [Platanthera zijinensis]|uniref:Uncharacterized protein n=1 Tax=Platanthera zijinensis TaxID=2320716 RepID=A0AAP0BFA4_9ASPA